MCNWRDSLRNLLWDSIGCILTVCLVICTALLAYAVWRQFR